MSAGPAQGRFAAAARLGARGAWWWLPLLLLGALVWLANGVSPTWREVRELALQEWQSTRCVPAAGEGWQPASLPFWGVGDCWLLRTRIDRPGLELEGSLLMLAGVHQDASVIVNGIQVRSADVHGDRSRLSGVLWLSLADGLLRPGSNELLLELRSGSGALPRVNLGSALIGPSRLMQDFQTRYEWLHAAGAGAVLVLLGGILLFLVPISIARPQEALYRWFALALVGSVVYVSNFAGDWRPLDFLAWAAAIHLGLVLAAYALARCSCALLATPVPRWPLLLAGAATLLVLLEAVWWPRAGTSLISLTYRLLVLALLAGLTGWWWRRRHAMHRPDGRWFAAAMVLLMTLGVLDVLRLLLRGVWSTPGYLLHWGILYIALLLFVVLLLRILDGLRQAERGRAELAIELAQRSRELEAEFGRRRAAESARMLADERARIMRDMHDGVGGQLVALIGQVQGRQVDAAQLAPQLRSTLDDLRLMIDSLDSACADLSVALGMFRARMEPMLTGQPVRVAWRTAHLPDLPPASPATVLHVLRILQEALTNALKHAQARRIEIAADWDGARLRIEVTDDGYWREGGSGRGLASMRARTAAIAGNLDIAHDANGTRVTLELPLG